MRFANGPGPWLGAVSAMACEVANKATATTYQRKLISRSPLFLTRVVHLPREIGEHRFGLRGVLRLVGARVAAGEHLAHLTQRSDVAAVSRAFGGRRGIRRSIQRRARLRKILVRLDEVIPAGRRCPRDPGHHHQAGKRNARHLHTESILDSMSLETLSKVSSI